MKKILTSQQHEELKKLGYDKDDSLASMIEFLIQNNSQFVKNDMGTVGAIEWVGDELCDALWEECKEILEEK
jgi:hypothetical protein